jgi:uncharacterized membrane protein YhaH (DUF805 family)
MLKDLFGNWGRGKLPPGRFAKLWLGCLLMVVLWPLSVGAFAIALKGIGSSGGTVGLLVFIWMLAGAAMFNITIKRGRDIGLSGTLTAISVIALFVFGGAPVLLTIALAFVPSQTFGQSASGAKHVPEA